jgi:ribonuclease R
MPKKTHHQRQRIDQAKGKLDITRSGMGYVMTDDEGEDVLVRPADFNRAFNGDTVRVNVTRPALRGKKREGVVVDVLHRKQLDFVGRLRGHAGRWLFLPDSDKPIPHFVLNADPPLPIDEDQKVLVRFVRWLPDDRRPIGHFLELLAPEDMSNLAMKDILLEKGFALAFSDEALEDAERMPDTIAADELAKRRDFRDVLTITIDPWDAKDFDDALSLRALPNGHYEVGVHIADVSHFVEAGTLLDDEAYSRATSVYLPDRVNPMLPERISNELCSLRPHQDKYTFSAVFNINSQAEVTGTWLGRTVIHSNHRFTYEEAQALIDGEEGPHQQAILTLHALAQLLRKKRFAAGAINFSSQEVRFKLDDKGKPIGVVIKENKAANQLIEEFMLLANRSVAERMAKVYVKDKLLPFPYRIHDTPDEEKMVPFAALARKFGYTFNLKDETSVAASFNEMLGKAKGTPQQHILEQLGIRTMAKAIYTAENIGHYGLGFEHYCHFTSPIRRYPDVMVHRILQDVLNGKPQPDKKMEQKCKHCSERERAAMEVERAANKYKQVEYMSQFLGQQFEAVITGVSTFGFWAETVAHKCEGLVSMKDLNYFDDFRLIESEYMLAGMRTGRTFRMGDAIVIEVVNASLEKRQLDYEWVMKPEGALAD